LTLLGCTARGVLLGCVKPLLLVLAHAAGIIAGFILGVAGVIVLFDQLLPVSLFVAKLLIALLRAVISLS